MHMCRLFRFSIIFVFVNGTVISLVKMVGASLYELFLLVSLSTYFCFFLGSFPVN